MLINRRVSLNNKSDTIYFVREDSLLLNFIITVNPISISLFRFSWLTSEDTGVTVPKRIHYFRKSKFNRLSNK